MYLRDMTASSTKSGIDPISGGTYGSGHRCGEEPPRCVRTVQPSREKGPSTDSALRLSRSRGAPAVLAFGLAPSTAGPRTVDPRVMDVAEARDLAHTCGMALGRATGWLHVQAVAARAEELRGAVPLAEGELLVAAAGPHAHRLLA